jgi:hypothetical protein
MPEAAIAVDAHPESVDDRARAGNRICRIGGPNRGERRRLCELASGSEACQAAVSESDGQSQRPWSLEDATVAVTISVSILAFSAWVSPKLQTAFDLNFRPNLIVTTLVMLTAVNLRPAWFQRFYKSAYPIGCCASICSLPSGRLAAIRSQGDLHRFECLHRRTHYRCADGTELRHEARRHPRQS